LAPDAVLGDINYSLPVFFGRGAGNTYFSGKMLSKLARILLIAEEFEEICEGRGTAVSDTFTRSHLRSSIVVPPLQHQLRVRPLQDSMSIVDLNDDDDLHANKRKTK
jgi:hypothetical protein